MVSEENGSVQKRQRAELPHQVLITTLLPADCES